MQAHYAAILKELSGMLDGASPEQLPELLDTLERLTLEVRSARFRVGHTMFGKRFKPADAALPTMGEVEGKFQPGQRVRTPAGYLAYVGYYDHKQRVVANVVYEACEFKESDLTPVKE